MDRKSTGTHSRRSRITCGGSARWLRRNADAEHELAAPHPAKCIDQALGVHAHDFGQANQAQQIQTQAGTGTGFRTSTKAGRPGGGGQGAQPLPPDLAAPVRKQADQAPPEPVNTDSVRPQPSVLPPPIEEQPAPKPEIDVAQMKREKALALAQKLRQQESQRLTDSLEKERETRLAQAQELQEEREQRVAQQLSEIRVAEAQPREPQAQDDSAAGARAITDDYRARISARIRQRVILPPDLQGNPEAIYTVSLLPGGTVTEVRLLKTSGVPTYDAAVERAILAAQPLPVPEDPALFQANFKNLRLNFRPKE